MEQLTGSKSGKEYIKACLFNLYYMQSSSCKMLGRMKHKLESRLPGEITAGVTPLMDESKEEVTLEKGMANHFSFLALRTP